MATSSTPSRFVGARARPGSALLRAALFYCSTAACTATIGVDDAAVGAANSPGIAGAGSTQAADPSMPGVVELAGGLTVQGEPKFFRVVRLTHAQWENATRDLLELPTAPGASSGFTPDPPDGRFSNNERALYVSDSLRGDYQRAAEALAEQVTNDPAALARLGDLADPVGFISFFGRTAYRRALSPQEEQRYHTIFSAGPAFYESGDAARDGARAVLEAMLQSPHFLYLVQLTPTGARLSGDELAAKLSFLLRNTAPGSALLTATAAGRLADDAGVLAVAGDMLADSVTSDVFEQFHDELYGLSRYGSIQKDSSLFPTYQELANESLRRAELLFFRRAFETGGGLRNLLTSQTAYVDPATAGFYGLTAPGAGFTEVTLGQDQPGFLTRVGFLAYNATLRDPDPIHRGVEINRRVLCRKLEPPPGEIPPLPGFVPDQTNRERVAIHTGSGVCGGCHGTLINPLGFAFEAFDALGQRRSLDNGKAVDTTGQYDFGEGPKPFNDARELIALLSNSQQAHGCYVANLTEFVLGRDLGGLDNAVVNQLQQASVSSDQSIKDALLSLILSPSFAVAQGAPR